MQKLNIPEGYEPDEQEIIDNESRSASATMITVMGVVGALITLAILTAYYLVSQVVKP